MRYLSDEALAVSQCLLLTCLSLPDAAGFPLIPEQVGEPVETRVITALTQQLQFTCTRTPLTTTKPRPQTARPAGKNNPFEFLLGYPMVERLPMTAAVAYFAACCTTGFAFVMTPGPGASPSSSSASPKVILGTAGGTKFVHADQRCSTCCFLVQTVS